MSITLTYLAAQARVSVEVDGLSVDEVRVEHSTNELHWETVRGGVALTPVDGEVELADDEFVSDAANHYRVVDVADGTVLEVDDITPSLGGQLWLKVIEFPSLNRPWGDFGVSPIGRVSRSVATPVAGRSLPVGRSDRRLGWRYELSVLALTDDDAQVLDLVLASVGTLLVHVPPELPVRGGYFLVGDTLESAMVESLPASVPRVFTLPLEAVLAPGPDVVGGTMTYHAMIQRFGSYANMVAAGSTYHQLLDLMADPDELVVL